ncbi:hypothetical protein ACLF6K_37530 [Streptomyces xanthophaeus]|uniref:hypothetical protein n=1 Tax=Streptomyces xanthophaeus TaxID=67385 RepID=UPI00398FC84B
MAERMAFILDGDDNLSPVFRRIGESADRFHRRINDAVDESGGELRAFTRAAGGGLQELGRNLDSAGRSADAMGDGARDATPAVQELGTATQEANGEVERFTRDSGGRLRDLRGRFLSAADAARMLAREAEGTAVEIRDVGTASERSSGSVGSMGGSVDRVRPSLARLGSTAASTSAQLGGSGGGLSASMGVVAGVAALSLLPALGTVVPMIAGLGVAAGTLKLGFSGIGEALEAASKGKKEYAAALKGLTPEARAFTKELVKTKDEFSGLGDKIQKAMLPGFTRALKDAGPMVDILGDAMVRMGGGFGHAAAGVGRLMKDSGFQKDFIRVLDLGDRFVRDLTRGLGGLTRGFLDFGAASGPTLTELSGGIGDLLGKGLPGMFDGLKSGIEGSSQFLNGFFTMLNQLLPKLGEFSGDVARTFGPFLGEQMRFFGNVLSFALDGLGVAVRALKPVFNDLMYGLKATWLVMEPFADAARAAGRALLDSFIPAGSGIEKVRGPLQRLRDLVEENKLGIMEYARMFGSALIAMGEAWIGYMPVIVGAFRMLATGALDVLSVLVIGAEEAFSWIPGIGEKLTRARESFGRFKEGFISGLNQAEEKTRNFSNQVTPRLAENKLKMNITSWESQIGVAKEQLKSVPPEKRSKLLAHINDLEKKAADARAELASVRDRHVGIYVTEYRTRTFTPNPRAGGQAHAAGGLIRGPGTGTSDSIASWLSDGEYVIRASSVARIGVGTLDALNAGRPLPAGSGTSSGTVARAAAPSPRVVTFAPQITVNGALDPIAVAQQLQKLQLKLQRDYGLPRG